MQMQALSLWRPWDGWLFARDEFGRPLKSIETRDWSRAKGLRTQAEKLIGQRIAIHAAKKYDYEGAKLAEETWHVKADSAHGPSGYLEGTVLLVGVRMLTDRDAREALCFCAGRFGLIFEDPKPFAEPIPCKGRQGFFRVEVPEGA